MPLLEAMSQGCIPIAGNHSSIPEVLDNAGIIINCDCVSQLAEAMKICLIQDSSIQNLIKRGFDRASYFRWNKSAKLTMEFYKEL
jgi:glycosyltransferase involved in cell wall biosynthesis